MATKMGFFTCPKNRLEDLLAKSEKPDFMRQHGWHFGF
jgi:hypothetical protein